MKTIVKRIIVQLITMVITTALLCNNVVWTKPVCAERCIENKLAPNSQLDSRKFRKVLALLDEIVFHLHFIANKKFPTSDKLIQELEDKLQRVFNNQLLRIVFIYETKNFYIYSMLPEGGLGVVYRMYFEAEPQGRVQKDNFIKGKEPFHKYKMPFGQNGLNIELYRNTPDIATALNEYVLPKGIVGDHSVPEGFIAYSSMTEAGDMMGWNKEMKIPVNRMDLEEIMDYLVEHPYDHYMLTYLYAMIESAGVQGLDVYIGLGGGYSLIALGLMFLFYERGEKGAGEAFVNMLLGSVKNQSELMSLMENQPNARLRAMLHPGLWHLHEMINDIFNSSRRCHKPLSKILSEMQEEELVALHGMLRTVGEREGKCLEEKPTRVDGSMSTGTSMRDKSIEDTIASVTECMQESGLEFDIGMGIAYCNTHTIVIEWILDQQFECDRNKYVVRDYKSCNGKGLNKDIALASALMEVAERYSAIARMMDGRPVGYKRIKDITKDTYSKLVAEGDNAINPKDMNLLFPYKDQELYWVSGKRKVGCDQEEDILVPAQIVFTEHNFDEPHIFGGSLWGTNGLASGNTIEEAKLHSILEIIERDADHTILYSPDRCFSLEADEDTEIGSILKAFREKGIAVDFMDLTNEFGVPSYEAFVQVNDRIFTSTGTHLNPEIAIARALCELTPLVMNHEEEIVEGQRIAGQTAFEIRTLRELKNYSTGSVVGDLAILEDVLIANGYAPIYVDLTREDLRVPVVRTIIPGMDMPYGKSKRRLQNLAKGIKGESEFRIEAEELGGAV